LLEFINKICEYTFANVKNKNKSITNLFPTFTDRVRQVAANGGVKMKSMSPGLWTFTVASGTTPGKKYTVYAQFADMEESIRKAVQYKEVWSDDKTHVDYRYLASKILDIVDMKWYCTDPSDLYYGGQYIRTQRDAEYQHDEDRPPRVRNPHQYGAGCKHLALVWQVLPMYVGTIANFLKKYYSSVVEEAEGALNRERDTMKQAAGALAQKRDQVIGRDEPPVGPEGEEEMSDISGPRPTTEKPPKSPEEQKRQAAVTRKTLKRPKTIKKQDSSNP
jgi:hypothetical protein